MQAVATVVLVVVTWTYVRLTRRVSMAAEAASRAAERALILDIAPIVLPRRTVGRGKVSGSLHNIGGRPAIEVEMEVFIGEVLVGKNAETLIRPGEQKNWEVVYDPNQTGITANAPFSIRSTYGAMTGDGFRTVKRYRPGDRHEFEVFLQVDDDWRRLSIAEIVEESVQ